MSYGRNKESKDKNGTAHQHCESWQDENVRTPASGNYLL